VAVVDYPFDMKGDVIVNAVQPPGRFALAFRACGAMVLTGLLSALLVAVATALFFSLMSGGPTHGGFSKFSEFVGFIWFFGSIVSTGCAIVLGLSVEWPKAWWHAKRRSGGFGLHLLISLVAAEALLLGWMMVSVRNDPVPNHDLAENLLFAAAVAAVGGACSAALWWRLVVLPMRRARQT
jgi:hypothetical protein